MSEENKVPAEENTHKEAGVSVPQSQVYLIDFFFYELSTIFKG